MFCLYVVSTTALQGDELDVLVFLRSSAIKSTITYPFYDNLGWYLILYSLNSMTHFNIRSDRFDLCMIALSGRFVSTIT